MSVDAMINPIILEKQDMKAVVLSSVSGLGKTNFLQNSPLHMGKGFGRGLGPGKDL